MKILTIIAFICDFVVAGVSLFAIIQYKLNRYHLKKSAATVVYHQLKDFDAYVDKLQHIINTTNEISDNDIFLLTSVIAENHWSKNKHILLENLTQDDIQAIDKVYETIERLENARNRIMETIISSLNAKSFSLQFHVAEMLKSPQNEENVRLFHDRINQSPAMFRSRMLYEMVRIITNEYRRMSGTTTFEKLRIMAYHNKKC